MPSSRQHPCRHLLCIFPQPSTMSPGAVLSESDVNKIKDWCFRRLFVGLKATEEQVSALKQESDKLRKL